MHCIGGKWRSTWCAMDVTMWIIHFCTKYWWIICVHHTQRERGRKKHTTKVRITAIIAPVCICVIVFFWNIFTSTYSQVERRETDTKLGTSIGKVAVDEDHTRREPGTSTNKKTHDSSKTSKVRVAYNNSKHSIVLSSSKLPPAHTRCGFVWACWCIRCGDVDIAHSRVFVRLCPTAIRAPWVVVRFLFCTRINLEPLRTI